MNEHFKRGSKIQRPVLEDCPTSQFDGLIDPPVLDSKGRVILFACAPIPATVSGEAPRDLLQELDPEFYAYIRGLPSTFVPPIELVYGLGAQNYPELVQKYEQYVSKYLDRTHHIGPDAIEEPEEESYL